MLCHHLSNPQSVLSRRVQNQETAIAPICCIWNCTDLQQINFSHYYRVHRYTQFFPSRMKRFKFLKIQLNKCLNLGLVEMRIAENLSQCTQPFSVFNYREQTNDPIRPDSSFPLPRLYSHWSSNFFMATLPHPAFFQFQLYLFSSICLHQWWVNLIKGGEGWQGDSEENPILCSGWAQYVTKEMRKPWEPKRRDPLPILLR